MLKLPVALAAPLVMSIVSGFDIPNLRLCVNQNTPDSSRAAVLSVATTVYSVGTGFGLLLAFSLANSLSSSNILWAISIGTISTILLSLLVKTKEKSILHKI